MSMRQTKSRHCFSANARTGKRGTAALNATIQTLERRTLLSHSWFVATTGLDTNPGTLAAPFATIQHAADQAGPGDVVDILAGTYHETVTVHHSGASGAPIVFQPYQNANVTLDGADPISGWTNTSGNIWTAPDSTDLGQGNNQIFVDGQMMNEARWPNTPLAVAPNFDLSHPTLATVTTASATLTSATITNAGLTQPPGFWVGSTIRIAAGQQWFNQTATVTASGTGFVTFTYQNGNARWSVPSAGNPFYLFGNPGALDSPGEFSLSSGKLSLWTPAGDTPASHAVEAKARRYGFDLSAASYVRLEGIHLFACTINTSALSNNVVIDRLTAQYIWHSTISPTGQMPTSPDGIILLGNSDALTNSVIAESSGDGVYVVASYVLISNDVIHDTDYSGVDAAPVRISGFGDSITHDTCFNTGRDGLLFTGSHDTITYNNVYNYGLQTQDLGGFYTVNRSGNATVIAYNKFHDAITGGFGGVGVMLDDNSSSFIIHHNITYHVNTGLRLVGRASGLKIINNTFDATTWGVDKDGPEENWAGTLLENNIITHPVIFGDNVQAINNISNHHQFVDAPNGNFTLLSGAPAVDTGLLYPPYTNGYVGPAPDVGALELGLPPFVVGANVALLPPIV